MTDPRMIDLTPPKVCRSCGHLAPVCDFLSRLAQRGPFFIMNTITITDVKYQKNRPAIYTIICNGLAEPFRVTDPLTDGARILCHAGRFGEVFLYRIGNPSWDAKGDIYRLSTTQVVESQSRSICFTRYREPKF